MARRCSETRHGSWSACLILLACASTAFAEEQVTAKGNRMDTGKIRVYVGTYTNKTSRGIYRLDLDPASGELTDRGLAAETASPSFLAFHPSRRFLFAVNEVEQSGGQKDGGVSVFAIDPKDGGLTPLNQRSSRGAGPCHLTVDRAGKNVLVANYGGGSVAVLPIGEDGRLGDASAFVQHQGAVADPVRQKAPHAHSINLDRNDRFACAADLGLDRILVYRFDPAMGTLTPNEPPSGRVAPRSGPRHFAFHPDGQHAYVINEISSTVTAFEYDAERGVLEEVQTLSTLPEGFQGRNSTAEVQVHPSGRFLYGSNRGHDSIAIFAIDAGSGKLRAVGHQSTQGRTPRNFGIDPKGRFLLAANQGTGTVVVFRIDDQTGKLEPTGKVVDVPSPVCVKMMEVTD